MLSHSLRNRYSKNLQNLLSGAVKSLFVRDTIPLRTVDNKSSKIEWLLDEFNVILGENYFNF